MLIITMLLPTNVYAGDDKGNGGGQNSSGSIGSGTDKGNNPFYKYTGWLVYVAKKAPIVEGEKRGKATIVNNKVVFVCSGTSTPSGYDASYLRPRLNEKIVAITKDDNSKYFLNAPWGVPFDDKGNAKGKEIRDMFEDDTKHFSDNPKESNREFVIYKYLGPSVYNQVAKDPNNYYLMLEACAWYTGRDGHGGYYDIAASTYGWAKAFKAWKKTPKEGDGRDWCALYRLPRSCYLNGDWPCLPKHPTDFGPQKWVQKGDGISYEKILDTKNTDGLGYGYGMLAIKTNLQTTCNETLKVPHQPPHEIKDSYKYTIIKNYVIKNGDGTYESVKCTSKTDSFQKIKIEPEEKTTGYKLVAWRATTKNYPDDKDDHYPQDLFKKAVDDKGKLVWFDKVPGTEKAKGKAEKDSKGKFKEIVGKDGKIIDMEDVDEKGARANTVFLLLVKEDDIQTQTTCDEKKDKPHQPADESKGTYTIIKNYVDKKGDTYKSKKCTSKTNSSPIIKVEPEEKTTGYKLVAYAATTKSYKDKDSEKEHNPLNLLAAVNDEGELVWENAVKNELGTNKMFKGSQKNTTELKGGTFNLTKDELKV